MDNLPVLSDREFVLLMACAIIGVMVAAWGVVLRMLRIMRADILRVVEGLRVEVRRNDEFERRANAVDARADMSEIRADNAQDRADVAEARADASEAREE